MQLALNLSELKRDWLDAAAPAVLREMAGVQFTADDLHEILPTPEHLNWFGVLLASMSTRGMIEKIGYRPSERKERNGSVVAIWTVCQTHN